MRRSVKATATIAGAGVIAGVGLFMRDEAATIAVPAPPPVCCWWWETITSSALREKWYFGLVQDCLTGPGGQPSACCRDTTDTDCDGDVDLADLARHLNCVSHIYETEPAELRQEPRRVEPGTAGRRIRT